MRGQVDDLAPGSRPGRRRTPLALAVRDKADAVKQLVEGRAVDPLVLDEIGGEAAKGVHVGDERPRRFGIGFVEDRPNRPGGRTLDLGRQRSVP